MTPHSVRCAPVSMICAALACAPLLAHEPSNTVTVVVLPGGHYSKLAVHEMGREASHILKQSDLSVRVRVGVPTQAVTGRLVVVKLVGRCDMDGSPAFLEPGPLGWAHAVNGTVL